MPPSPRYIGDPWVPGALDGVAATWLDDSDKRALAARVRAEAVRLRPDA